MGLTRWSRLISIHTPLAGSDVDEWIGDDFGYEFQSTLPLRGATLRYGIPYQGSKFQSTLPLRGATCTVPSVMASRLFQSTLPLRGATV